MRNKPREKCTCPPPVDDPTGCTTAPIRDATDADGTTSQCPILVAEEDSSSTVCPTTICEHSRRQICDEHAETTSVRELDTCPRNEYDHERSDRDRPVIMEDCAERCYPRDRKPQRSLYMTPVYTPKPCKEPKKRCKKGAKLKRGGLEKKDDHDDDGVPVESNRAKRNDDDESATTTKTYGTKKSSGGGGTRETTKKPSFSTSTAKKKRKKQKQQRQQRQRKVTQEPTDVSGKVYHLRRAKVKKGTIDWKKAPSMPVKQTATSKLRREYWFAECGKYRVKAYRGDWSNFPADLLKDYEVYENYFKHRRRDAGANKTVGDKGKTRKPPPKNDRKPFSKRSPVLPATAVAGSRTNTVRKPFRKRSPIQPLPKTKSKSKFKSKSSSRSSRKTGRTRVNVGYLQKRAARFDLVKRPLIEVKQTKTTILRSTLESAPCDKPNRPTFWHGTAEEMQHLKETIERRRQQLRNKYKILDDQRRRRKPDPTPAPDTPEADAVVTSANETRSTTSGTVKPDTAAHSMNNLMMISNAPTTEELLTRRLLSSKSKSAEKAGRMGARAKPEPLQPPPVELYARKTKTATSVSRQQSLTRCAPRRRPNATGADTICHVVTRLMLPPAIPIRQSLTSVMRRRISSKERRRKTAKLLQVGCSKKLEHEDENW